MARAIRCDGEGNLLQSNFFANNVVKISRNGKAEELISSGLNGPVGIEVDTDRNILVCNFAGNYVSTTSPDGVTKVLAKSELFNGPNGITLHPDGRIYVTNYGNDQILKIDKSGSVDVLPLCQAVKVMRILST